MTRRPATVFAAAIVALAVLGVVDASWLVPAAFMPLGSFR